MARIQQFIKKLLLISELEVSLQTDSTQILRAIRERIVTVLLRICALLGLISVSVGSWALWQTQNWAGILIGNLALAGVIYLAWRRHIDYRIRSIALIFISYLYILASLLQGISELSLAILFAFVVMTTLLLGQTGGIIAFLLSLVTILFTNWGITVGLLQFTPSIPPLSEPLPTVLVIYTDWLFFTGIFLFSIWAYFDGFRIAWEREWEATKLLAEERDRLKQAVTREQALLEEITQAHQREIELSRMKSQIITTVSHEFRTPLTVIGNSVELLTRYGHNFDLAKQEAIHRRIDDSIYYLTELLQDASSVNKAYAEGFQANMVLLPFNGLAQRLRKELLHECNDPANVQFEYDSALETAVSVDYDFVHRICLIYLNNALKYAPPNSSITVSLCLDEQFGVLVHDHGIGIPPDEIQEIWSLFFRGQAAGSKRGMGLGLYLAKRLAQAMNGTVTAVSPGHNQGSTFTLQIPQLNS